MPNNGWLPLVVGPRKTPCVLYLAIHEENIYEKYSQSVHCALYTYTHRARVIYTDTYSTT